MRLFLCLSLLFSPVAAQACDGHLAEGPGLFAAPLCLPEEAKRIAVLDPSFSLGMALELGLPVVAAPLSGMSDKALLEKAQAAGVIDIGFVWEPSAEALVGARPDLIIGSSFAGEAKYDLLTSIAPTALITPPDWREYYAVLAGLVGREARMQELLAPLQARIAEMRGRIPDRRVSVVRVTAWDFQVYPQGPGAWAPFALMEEVGVHRTAYETAEDATMPLRPDWEELGQLDGDILLTIVGGMNDASARWAEVTANPLWQMLPAVQAGHVHSISPGVWMEFSGVTAANRVLDDIERLVIAAP